MKHMQQTNGNTWPVGKKKSLTTENFQTVSGIMEYISQILGDIQIVAKNTKLKPGANHAQMIRLYQALMNLRQTITDIQQPESSIHQTEEDLKKTLLIFQANLFSE